MTQSTMNFDIPSQRHSPTSQAAAEAIKPDAARQRGIVLAAIRESCLGVTDEEGMKLTGLQGSSYRPRRIELVQAGKVNDSGQTRLTAAGRKATVWTAT